MYNDQPVREYHFSEFVAKFPPVSLPVTLGEDTHHIFSQENPPFAQGMVSQFIVSGNAPGDRPDDEFTEYVPCFAIEDMEKFVALVWWKAGLLYNEYVLATFDMKGTPISRQVIAYMAVDEGRIRRAVATINEEYDIFIASGETDEKEGDFDPEKTSTRMLEIMANGEVA